MSGLPQLLVLFLAAVNPPAVALGAGGRRARVMVAAALVAGATVLLAGASGPVLDLLDLSPESFRLAAGIVLAAGGLRLLVLRPPSGDTSVIAVLATPELAAAAVTAGADAGVVRAGLAAVVALAAAGLLAVGPAGRGTLLATAARLMAGVLVAVAVGLAVDGVLSV